MRMPSWWMPASCAKALRADDRLVRLHADADDRRSAAGWPDRAARCLMPVVVRRGDRARVFSTITISSSEQLPARSPMPLMVHSTWRAPFWTAASELATASPRSLWQWTLTTADDRRAPSTTWPISAPYSSGMRVADGVGDVDRAWRRRRRPPARPRSGNRARCARRPRRRTRRRRRACAPARPPAAASSSTCSCVIFSLYLRWMSLVARKTWMRGAALALLQRLARRARCRAACSAPARRPCTGTSRLTACTASKSPGEAIGKPASMMSTPSSASLRAMRSFSGTVMLQPGRLLAVAQRGVEDEYAVVGSSPWTSIVASPV